MEASIVSTSGGTTSTSSPNTVFVSMPPHGTILPAGSKVVQSVIQQNQASVIQSPGVQAVQVSKGAGNVIFLKGTNSVIQSAPGQHGLHGVQVIEAEPEEGDRKHQRQILVRRPSYRKIFNELSSSELAEREGASGGGGGTSGTTNSNSNSSSNSGGGNSESISQAEAGALPTTTLTIGGQEYTTASLLKVIPASTLQLATSGTEALQTIAMSGAAASSGGTILHYNTGSDTQFIVPVGSGDLSSLKFSSGGGGIAQGVVLAAAATPPSVVTTSASALHSTDNMSEEANRKREVRLLKNREAARECRAKKKEYIKCLENRVAVLENQNKALIEELKNLKAMYCQGS